MKNYEAPEFELVSYKSEDVLTTTGEQQPTEEYDPHIFKP